MFDRLPESDELTNGHECLLNVVHEVKGGDVHANIKEATPLLQDIRPRGGTTSAMFALLRFIIAEPSRDNLQWARQNANAKRWRENGSPFSRPIFRPR
jgi:hypothetical protein